MHTTPQQALVTVVVECTLHCTDHPGAADWLLLGTGLCLTLLRSQASPDCEADGAHCHTVTQIEPALQHLLAR